MKEKMSTLKFWNKNNEATNDAKTDAKNTKNGRNWLHAPDALVTGHVAYLVKFLGSTPVDQPKGIEVVKEAIRRLQFTQQIKKADGGGNNNKMKKVEITISVDGVAVQEPRTNNILHQFPLHKISYCADEKGVKKFFSFIAKMGTSVQSQSNGDSNSINTSSSSGSTTSATEESHECFVFISNKLASDITLTIGQAFDLAYRRYMSDSGKQFEISKLQSHNKILENTVQVYRSRLREVSEIMSKSDLDRLMLRLGLRDICEVPPEIVDASAGINGSKTPDLGIDVSAPHNDDQMLIETSSSKHFAPIVPPRNQMSNPMDSLKPSVGTKLEGLLLNSDSDSDFDPRAEEADIMSHGMSNGNKISNDLFGFEPPKSQGQQLFSTGSFSNGTTNMSMNAPPTSPPPLLAPPPKVATPRRVNGTTPNIMNGINQDLFGSDPFHPASNTSRPFDVSSESLHENADFNEFAFNTFGDNSFNTLTKPLALATQIGKLDDGLHKSSFVSDSGFELMSKSPSKSTSNPFLAKESPKKSNLLQKSSEMMALPKSNRYDVFKNVPDFDVEAKEVPQNAQKTETTPAANPDLFKDFSIQAFNEFKSDKLKIGREFSNKMFATIQTPSTGGGAAGFIKKNDSMGDKLIAKNSFKNGLLFDADDFTLESLDPLGK